VKPSKGDRDRDGVEQLALPVRLAPKPRSKRRGAEPAARRVFTTAGLFAGIGGIELGFSRAGHEAALFCENDRSATAVLNARFPGVPVHPDVRELRDLPKKVNLLAGGFPCQDLSQAGKTAGITGERSGLVGEVFRLLEAHEVPWVVLENVPFMLQLGRGRALEVVLNALERLGYRWAYRVVDTRAFGLPQRRERVFFVASREGDPRDVLLADDVGEPAPLDAAGLACGFYWTEGIRGLGWAVNAVPTLKGGSTIGIPSAPAIWMPDGTMVKPDLRDAERMQGFESGWTEPAEKVVKRGYRWKLVGNAVTVDVAAWLGERLAAPGSYSAGDAYPLKRGAPWPRAAWNMGQGRFVAPVSAYPVRRRAATLHKFLRYRPDLLSVKGAAGFLSRARSGSLRFPPGFIDAVEAHLRRMESSEAA
jgi:DNA (cytosine-5)-methyltransferase 1